MHRQRYYYIISVFQNTVQATKTFERTWLNGKHECTVCIFVNKLKEKRGGRDGCLLVAIERNKKKHTHTVFLACGGRNTHTTVQQQYRRVSNPLHRNPVAGYLIFVYIRQLRLRPTASMPTSKVKLPPAVPPPPHSDHVDSSLHAASAEVAIV